MPTVDIYGTFDGTTGLVGLSIPCLEVVYTGTTGLVDLSPPIVDQLNLNQQAGLSNPLMNYAGSPVLLLGIDPVTGASRPLVPGEPLVRTNGSAAFATGIHGLTGVQGSTGLALQGATGLVGPTGVAGTTGVVGLPGFTGVLGTRGVTGFTGEAGIQGSTGVVGYQGINPSIGYMILGSTGVQGTTGLIGRTGVSAQGVTGVGGAAFDAGLTGLRGITGASSTSSGITGVAGIAGSTGTIGITGITERGMAQPLITLSVQTTPAVSMQYTLPGNTLASNGNNLDIITFGSLVANTSNSLQITFGGSTIFADSNIYAEATPAFYCKCRIFRNTSTEQQCLVEVIASNAYKRIVRTITSHSISSDLTLVVSTNTSSTVSALLVRSVS